MAGSCVLVGINDGVLHPGVDSRANIEALAEAAGADVSFETVKDVTSSVARTRDERDSLAVRAQVVE